MIVYVICIYVSVYSVKAILCFLGQRVKILGPKSRLSGVAIWKNYLNSQWSSVSWSIKIVLQKSCLSIKSPKSLEIGIVWTKQH